MVQSTGQVDLADLQSRVTLADVLTAAGYDAPNRAGFATCPIHAEKTASLKVYPDGHGHCFGCGWHGDVIDLTQRLHKFAFREAVAYLASMAGIAVSDLPRVDTATATARKKARQERKAAQRSVDRLKLAAADKYRELTKQARWVGAALALCIDNDDTWARLDALYTQRDHVEALEVELDGHRP